MLKMMERIKNHEAAVAMEIKVRNFTPNYFITGLKFIHTCS